MFILIAIRRLGQELVESRRSDVSRSVNNLRECLADPNSSPIGKGNNIYVLGAFADGCGELAVDAIPLLKTCLQDSHFTVRGGAAFTLGWIGPSAKDTIPLLEACLQDPDSYVRAGAEFALKRMKA